ncbi:hypothetical protein [Candidatus Ichthyocystis sparus]|uniref:hypothetical protein n=1 Tax=Candidatus Ichthyocystis sparus TaxID=1561004 RepID=UPI000B804A9C|nr:hypothetical protein [Candidatus Ichthyocystis sparus]
MSTNIKTIYVSSMYVEILGTDKKIISDEKNKIPQIVEHLLEDNSLQLKEIDLIIGADISEQLFVPWISSIENNPFVMIDKWCSNFYVSQKRNLISFQKKLISRNYREPIESIFFYDVEKELLSILDKNNISIRNIYISWLHSCVDNSNHLSVMVEQNTLTSVYWKNRYICAVYQEKIMSTSTNPLPIFIKRSFLQMNINDNITSIHISYLQHQELIMSGIEDSSIKQAHTKSISGKNIPYYYRINNSLENNKKRSTFMVAASILILSLFYIYSVRTYINLINRQSIQLNTPSPTIRKAKTEILQWMFKSKFNLLSIYQKIKPKKNIHININRLSIKNPNFYHLEGTTPSLEDLNSYIKSLQTQFPKLSVHLDKYSLEKSRQFVISIGNQNE